MPVIGPVVGDVVAARATAIANGAKEVPDQRMPQSVSAKRKAEEDTGGAGAHPCTVECGVVQRRVAMFKEDPLARIHRRSLRW